ncbi:MAG: 6-phosphogluconolactonase [PVC group bacterium]
MGFKVIITRDFDHMSEAAAGIMAGNIQQNLAAKNGVRLGLATGNTPTGLYKHLAKIANGGGFDPARVTSFNLDEYVGLPGENAQQRALHPESYCFFMIQELFGLLRTRFREANLPAATVIEQEELISALADHPADWKERGGDRGRAIVIGAEAVSPCLRRIRRDILDAYQSKIEAGGGIDLHLIGVGGRGHVGFHEAGIPFDDQGMLLVRLDDNTIENAIADGHFPDRDSSPRYAVSMSAPLVYRAQTVLLVANGPRKAEPLARSLLMEPDCSVPISYGHRAVREGRDVIYVLDRAAAAEVLAKLPAVEKRGIEVEDVSSRSASVPVENIAFRRDPAAGRLV